MMVPTLMMPLPSPKGSVTDCEEIRSDDGTAHRPLARLRRRRAGGWRTVLGLEEIRDVLLRVHRNGFGATHRGYGRDHCVFVGAILSYDGDVAVTPGRDVDQLLYRVPPQRVDPVAVRDRGDDLARLGVEHHRGLAAP